MDAVHINHLAVIIAALSDFAVGALWYSPLLFGAAWMKVNHFGPEDLKKGNPAVTYSIVFVLALIVSYNLAFFLGTPETDTAWGVAAGVLAGVWAVAAMAIVALFEKRSLTYILINGGYVLIAFAVKGLILGAWR